MYYKFISVAIIISSISAYFVYQNNSKTLPENHIELVNKQKTTEPESNINSFSENLSVQATPEIDKDTTEKTNIHLSTSQQEAEEYSGIVPDIESEIEQPGIEPEFTRLLEAQMQEHYAVAENYHPIVEENLSNEELLEEIEQTLALIGKNTAVTTYSSDTEEYSERREKTYPVTDEENSNEENNNFSDFGTNESIMTEIEEQQLIAEQHSELLPEYQSDQTILDEIDRETTHNGISISDEP